MEIVIRFVMSHRILFICFGAAFFTLLAAFIAWRLQKRTLRAKINAKVMTENAAVIHIGNAQNIGARENQQDSFGISDITNEKLTREKGILAVIADGMGGLSNGAQVSAQITSYMLDLFIKAESDPDNSTLLLNMVQGANKEVIRLIGNQQSGSTVVAVTVKEHLLHFISVGDSRIYLLRGGALFQINREHTYASELDEKAARGDITFDEAKSDPQRGALTSYIGMNEITLIDRSLRPIKLLSGDRILLMTDGVFGTISEEEILSAAGLSAYEAAAQLEALVMAKKKPDQDNFTIIILEC